jgi:putative DNA methylase
MTPADDQLNPLEMNPALSSKNNATTIRKKLIEVSLPLSEINDAAAYDKMPGIGAHPKGIHHWWARLPLPAARAVLFASVVDDPSSWPERFPTEEAQKAERERLFGILRRLMQPRLHAHPEVYEEARLEMLRHCEGPLPPLLDPFAGGGSIPLEAARLGLKAYAGDINPVAVLLNKCYLEIVPRWAGRPPVNPRDRQKLGGQKDWKGVAGLVADLRYYGELILGRARKRLGHLYPPILIAQDMAEEHPHLKPYVGRALPVIAWLWARTVPSPNPAARGTPVPLLSTFWLSSRKGSEAWLEAVVEPTALSWCFRVRIGSPPNKDAIRAGTKIGRATFRCLLTGAPIPDDYIKAQAKAGQMETRLIAIVAGTGKGRLYLPATDEHETIARQAQPSWKPEEPLKEKAADQLPLYGLSRYFQLFTPRQLTAMVTLSDLVREVRPEVEEDAKQAGLPLTEAHAYATAITTFLALALDRCADFNNALCRWVPTNQKVMNLFARQAIPMVWDFAEANLLGESVGSWVTCSDYIAECVSTTAVTGLGHALVMDAARSAASRWVSPTGTSALFQSVSPNGTEAGHSEALRFLVSTDPPYYDNIGYAALSDFFYVWLRRTIGEFYPEVFRTLLTPKEGELVAAPERFGGDRHRAKEHFEAGFRRAFAALREKMDPRFPLTVYYAFKQDDEAGGAEEEARANGHRVDRTTGWETMLTALIETGFQITATWPVRSAQKWRQNAIGANALASYIVLACRPRPADAPQTDRRTFVAELRRELPKALHWLQQGHIAPVDFAQAAIGPGMAIYSKYSRILEANGRPMSVRTALALINQTLTEVLSEQEDAFDADTRWAIAWYEEHGFAAGDYGSAELLSKAKVTSIRGLEEAGLVKAEGGRVRLLHPKELPETWDPAKDPRPSVWKATHHLVRVYWENERGEAATAHLLRQLGSQADYARDLAYRLFTIAEKKGRSADAQAYNALVVGWSELMKLRQAPVQGNLLESKP